MPPDWWSTSRLRPVTPKQGRRRAEGSCSSQVLIGADYRRIRGFSDVCHTKDRMPLVPPYIEALRPYEAGRGIEEVQREYGLTRVSKLASNENPLGPSPLALQAMAD